jgi:hypothetical protein
VINPLLDCRTFDLNRLQRVLDISQAEKEQGGQRAGDHLDDDL